MCGGGEGNRIGSFPHTTLQLSQGERERERANWDKSEREENSSSSIFALLTQVLLLQWIQLLLQWIQLLQQQHLCTADTSVVAAVDTAVAAAAINVLPFYPL